MSDNTVTRVNYFEGQFLRTQDFTDEQAYHVAMRRRHNISHHTWGIVSGLELVLEEGNFFVQPGMAIDGYGRELILPQRQTLPSSAFVDKGSKELEVWLIYSLISSDKPPAGYAGCVSREGNGNGNGNGNSEASFYRLQETAQVILERPDLDYPDRRQPKGLSVQDRNFDASRTPPDCPKSYWPVFLGTVINDPANKQEPFAVKLDDRPYVGLVGEAIYAPSGRARVQVGAERADDRRRFVVSTRADPTVVGGVQTVPTWQPRIDIDTEGELSIRGDASMHGNLTMAGGAIEFEAGTVREPTAHPWNIYHLSRTNPVGLEELRIEMAAAKTSATAGNNRVVIGAWFKGPDETGQQKEMFHPCLTIRDDLTVEVSGNLVVRGLVTGNITAASVAGGHLSEAARNAAASALISGILATSSRLPEISEPSRAARFQEGAEPMKKVDALGVEGLADLVAADPALLDVFAKRMKKDHPQEAESLRGALS